MKPRLGDDQESGALALGGVGVVRSSGQPSGGGGGPTGGAGILQRAPRRVFSSTASTASAGPASTSAGSRASTGGGRVSSRQMAR